MFLKLSEKWSDEPISCACLSNENEHVFPTAPSSIFITDKKEEREEYNFILYYFRYTSLINEIRRTIFRHVLLFHRSRYWYSPTDHLYSLECVVNWWKSGETERFEFLLGEIHLHVREGKHFSAFHSRLKVYHQSDEVTRSTFQHGKC